MIKGIGGRGKRGLPGWALVFGIMLFLFAVSGCGTLQTLVNKDSKPTPLADWIGSAVEEKSVPAISNVGDGKNVLLYFPDSSGKALVKEERTLPKTVSLARETVVQWLKGPADMSDAQAAVDPTTSLNDINIKEGVATVDLSREFTLGYGRVSQEVAVYGLVNTLTQFPSVHQVKLRINGKPLTKLGILDVSNLTYRESLIKGSSFGKSTTSGQPQSSEPSVEAGSGGSLKPKTVLPAQKDSPSAINLF